LQADPLPSEPPGKPWWYSVFWITGSLSGLSGRWEEEGGRKFEGVRWGFAQRKVVLHRQSLCLTP